MQYLSMAQMTSIPKLPHRKLLVWLARVAESSTSDAMAPSATVQAPIAKIGAMGEESRWNVKAGSVHAIASEMDAAGAASFTIN